VNALRQALLQSRRRPRLAGAGSPTVARGDGYEFVELRDYIAGDDVRRIDWAATARTGTLQTRVVLEDVSLTLSVLVDASPSMNAGRERPLAHAAREAAAAWAAATESGDRFFEEHTGSLPQALEVALRVLPRGTALLVISDFFDLPQDDDLLFALALRFDCTALAARDPWYGGLPLRGFVRVRDAESSEQALLYVGPRERRSYAAAVREREESLIARFERCGWRTGVFDERDGAHALLRAFGLR
jgi:uncharacterized protein (DUF58 family)